MDWIFLLDRHLLPLVDVGGYVVIQSLVGPFEIEEAEVVSQAEGESRHGVVVPNIDVLIFDGTPEPFDKDVVQCPAPSIHADFDVFFQEPIGEARGGELAALVRVKDFGGCDREGFLQGLDAEVHFQRVRQFPGQHIPAEPVHHGDQIHKALCQADIGDVRAPNLIGMINGQPPQQVGINAMLGMGATGIGTRINGFQSHFSH